MVRNDWGDWVRRIYTKARKNAEARGIPFDLSWEDMQSLAQKAEGRCMLTGIPFSFVRTQSKRRPFTASLDRIVSVSGYSLENCRLVCCAVNLAMNEWGEGVLRFIAHAIANEDRKAGRAVNIDLTLHGLMPDERRRVAWTTNAGHLWRDRQGKLYVRFTYTTMAGRRMDVKRRVANEAEAPALYRQMRDEVEIFAIRPVT